MATTKNNPLIEKLHFVFKESWDLKLNHISIAKSDQKIPFYGREDFLPLRAAFKKLITED